MDYSERSLFRKVALFSSSPFDKKRGKKMAVISLSSIPLIMTLGNSMLIPVLPVMKKELGVSSFQISLIITVYSLVAIILIPIAGFLSDHFGRKKVIIPSLIIAAAGGLICGWAAWKAKNPYGLILAGRALKGIGAAGAAPIVMPLVGDMFKNEKDVSSTLGAIETSNTLGKVLSPVLGAFLAGFLWFMPFLIFPVLCVFSIILMAVFIKRGKTEYEPVPFKVFRQRIKKIFKYNGRWLLSIFLNGVIIMFILFGVLFYLSEILEKDYAITNLKKGLFLAIPLGAICISSFVTGKVIKENKVLMKFITLAGMILLTGSIILLTFSEKLWFMISMFIIGGIGIGAGLPCLDSLITDGIRKEQRGTVTSFYNAMRFVGVAAGPPAAAIMMKSLPEGIFYILGGISLLAVFITMFGIRPEKEKA